MTTVVASAGSAAAGTSVSVTVTEKDAYGNLVTGKTVALTKSAGTHATYTPASKATTNGVAKFTVTDTVAEAVTFTAKNTTPAVTFTTTPSVTWKAGPPALTKSTVVASSTALKAVLAHSDRHLEGQVRQPGERCGTRSPSPARQAPRPPSQPARP